MASNGRFSIETVQLLGKRAALHCSNPECGVLTAGPSMDNSDAVVIGEAAHIYGRTETAARFNPNLTSQERADITNGIWLCRNCHREVDSDPIRFSSNLLFEWRKLHEQSVLERLGKRNDLIRKRLEGDRLARFLDRSRLAQQIVTDKPPHWEYKLTAELLRTGLGAVNVKWQHLSEGLYVRKTRIVFSIGEMHQWVRAQFADIVRIIGAVNNLISSEFPRAWGAPGEPGDELRILDACEMLVSAASGLLEWEEGMRFTQLRQEFEEVQFVLAGLAGRQLEEIAKIPSELSRIFDEPDPQGQHEIKLVFSVPDDFEIKFNTTLLRCVTTYEAAVRAGEM